MTPTFEALVTAELTAPGCEGNREAAYARALSTYAFLLLVPTMDKSDLPIPARTLTARRAALRNAGITPVTTPEALAALAEDLGVADETSLIRIVWTLHDDKFQSRATALGYWRDLIDKTIEIVLSRATNPSRFHTIGDHTMTDKTIDTQKTGVAPDATTDCPEFKSALLAWANGNPELADYIMSCVGSSLMPEVDRRKMFILHGPRGGSGKSTFMQVIAAVLGDYAASIDASALMTSRKAKTHDEALAPIIGRRFVYAEEVEPGQTLDLPLTKRLTSNDPIPMRRIRQKATTVRPTCTIWLGVNALPYVPVMERALRDLVRVIPFDARFTAENADRDLARRLVATEGPAILASLLESMRKVRAEGGLGEPPAAVVRATQEYFEGETPRCH